MPVDHLQEAIDATIEIGRRHDLPACSWGHAGDGNLHSTFMIDVDDPAELERAEHAAEDLFALAVELGGSVSGEHGIGLVKNGQIERQWAPAAVAMHEAIKHAFDPKGLLNPGKKFPREVHSAQVVPVRHRGRLRPALDSELRQDPRDVHARGLLGHEQRRTDLSVGRALGDQRQHLPLACGQPERILGTALRPGAVSVPRTRTRAQTRTPVTDP